MRDLCGFYLESGAAGSVQTRNLIRFFFFSRVPGAGVLDVGFRGLGVFWAPKLWSSSLLNLF